jgi:hypothetical protein
LRKLYTTVVHSAITTCCPALWAPPEIIFFRKGAKEELQKPEKQYLTTIAGVNRAKLIWGL